MQLIADHYSPKQAREWLRAHLPGMTWEQKRINIVVAACVVRTRLAKPTALGMQRYHAILEKLGAPR
jgi:hypothetical protein